MNYLPSVSNVKTWINTILETIKIPISQIGDLMETLRKTRLAKILLEFNSSTNHLMTWSLSISPENIIKLLIFWFFQGV